MDGQASGRLQAALLIAAAVMLLTGLGRIDAWAPDEPRYLHVSEGVRALENGPSDLVLLRLNGEPYTQKPPLYFWLAALGGVPTGHVGEIAARLPSALAGIGVVALTLLLGSRLFGGRVGLLGALLLLTVFEFAHVGRRIQLDMLLGEGPTARSIRLDMLRCALVGATTRAGLLTSPLRDRFGWSARLEYYPVDDLEEIVTRSGGLLGMELEQKAAHEIARRSRGTPRIANRLLRRVRDFSTVRDGDAEHIKLDTTRFALGRLDVDEAGFDGLDRSFLTTLVEKFGGGPVGLETLAAAVGEDKGTLEDVVEPYLIHCGFLTRTPRGRVATPHAYTHLGLPLPKS